MSSDKCTIFFFSEANDGTFFYRARLFAMHSKTFDVDTNIRLETGDVQLRGEQLYKRMLSSGVIVFIRPLRPQYLTLFFALKGMGKIVIVDNDDAVDVLETTNPAYTLSRFSNVYKLYLQHAHYSTVSTNYLKEYIKKNIQVHSIVIPNYIYESYYKKDTHKNKLRKNNEKFRIGLSGSVFYEKKTREVVELLAEFVKNKINTRIVLFGNYSSAAEIKKLLPKNSFEIVPSVSPEYYPKVLSNLGLDLMLIPRDDNNFNKSKSNCKFLECALAEIPVLAEKMVDGPYAEIEHEKTGFLVGTNQEWRETLEKIYLNKNIAAEVAQNAKAYVRQHYLIEKHINSWENIYVEAIKGHKTPVDFSEQQIPVLSKALSNSEPFSLTWLLTKRKIVKLKNKFF
jgi:glycosyltransferase involved in cell wall biosynthesis